MYSSDRLIYLQERDTLRAGCSAKPFSNERGFLFGFECLSLWINGVKNNAI